jgi:hypothetical protein
MTQYSYTIPSTIHRGVAVVGAYLPQGGIGFIYRPLVEDDPKPISTITLEEIDARVASESQKAGGRISPIDGGGGGGRGC